MWEVLTGSAEVILFLLMLPTNSKFQKRDRGRKNGVIGLPQIIKENY